MNFFRWRFRNWQGLTYSAIFIILAALLLFAFFRIERHMLLALYGSMSFLYGIVIFVLGD